MIGNGIPVGVSIWVPTVTLRVTPRAPVGPLEKTDFKKTSFLYLQPIAPHTSNTRHPTATMKSQVFNFSDINVDSITCEGVQTRPIPGKKETYQNAHQKLNVGTDAEPKEVDFLIRGPRMKTKSGIKKVVGDNGKIDYKISAVLSPDNPEHVAFMEFVTKLYAKYASIIYSVRKEVKKPLFNCSSLDQACGTGFMFPVYTPVDEGEEPVPVGEFPKESYMKLKLIPKYSTLSIVDGQVLKFEDWDKLGFCEFEFNPLINMSDLYFGAITNIQTKLKDAVIVSELKEKIQESMQKDLIEKFKTSRKSDVDKIRESFNSMKMRQRDSGDKQEKEVKDTKSTEGDDSSSPKANGTMSNIRNKGSVTSSMSDFTNGAPLLKPRVPTFAKKAQE